MSIILSQRREIYFRSESLIFTLHHVYNAECYLIALISRWQRWQREFKTLKSVGNSQSNITNHFPCTLKHAMYLPLSRAYSRLRRSVKHSSQQASSYTSCPSSTALALWEGCHVKCGLLWEQGSWYPRGNDTHKVFSCFMLCYPSAQINPKSL